MLSLLSNENSPLVPASTNAIPLLLEGLLSQPCTVSVMSIKRKLFKFALETVIGFEGEFAAPNSGEPL
jgi:hypothetical protein